MIEERPVILKIKQRKFHFCRFKTSLWEMLPNFKKEKHDSNLFRKNTLKTFFHQHNMRFVQVLEERLTSIKAASPLTMDDAVIIPHRLQALVFIEQLRVILGGIKQFDEEIDQFAHKHAITPYLAHYREQDLYLHHGCLSRLVSRGIVSRMRQTCRNTPVLRL